MLQSAAQNNIICLLALNVSSIQCITNQMCAQRLQLAVAKRALVSLTHISLTNCSTGGGDNGGFAHSISCFRQARSCDVDDPPTLAIFALAPIGCCGRRLRRKSVTHSNVICSRKY
jgi:hypothetical protein